MRWVTVGALLAAVAVGAGAFAAHGLRGRLDAASLELWETAARYLMYGGLGTAIAGLAGRLLGRRAGLVGACLLAGSLIFFGSVSAIALGGPRWLGAVTPVGGLLLLLGFVLLAALSWRGRQ